MRPWPVMLLLGCGRLDFDPQAADAPAGSCDPCLGAPAAVLDDFDRSDGPVGGAWMGDTAAFSIVGGTLAIANRAAIELPMLEPAAGQWVDLRIVEVGTDQEIGLVVQAQGFGFSTSRIEANYHEQSNAPGNHVHVAVAPGGNYTTQPYTVVAGDHVRAVDRGGHVQIFVDGVLVHEADAPGWTTPDAPGYIGIGGSFTAAQFRVDDFAGGACGCP